MKSIDKNKNKKTTVELTMQEISTIRGSLALTLSAVTKVRADVESGEKISLSEKALEQVYLRLSDIQNKLVKLPEVVK